MKKKSSMQMKKKMSPAKINTQLEDAAKAGKIKNPKFKAAMKLKKQGAMMMKKASATIMKNKKSIATMKKKSAMMMKKMSAAKMGHKKK